MYVGKWQTLAGSSVLELIAGLAYTFSLYAPALKAELRLSQTQLEGIGSALLAGGLFAVLPGFLYDSLSARHKLGPRLTAILGLLSHCIGYLAIWAAAAGVVSLPYWLLICAGLLASSGLIWLDTAGIITSMRNFPSERGSVAGILKTFLGLGASIAATVYRSVYAPDGVAFILFLATVPPALGLLATPLLNHVPHLEENEDQHVHMRLFAVGAAVAALLVYQLISTLVVEYSPPSSGGRLGIMVGAVAILFATLICIPMGTGGFYSKPHRSIPGSSQPEAAPLLSSQAQTERLQRRSGALNAEEGLAEDAPPVSQDEKKDSVFAGLRSWNLAQCTCSLEYWILWTALFVGIGSGFTLVSNLGQHVVALGGGAGSQDVYVLLFATFNCLGRMVFGFGGEWLLHRHAVPRTALLCLGSAGTAVVYLLIAFSNLRVLVPCVVLAGLLFGAHWTLMPSCTSELFGTPHFAANQSIIHLSSALSAFALNTELAGNWYERQGEKHGDKQGTCLGADCLRGPFLVIAALGLVQSVLSFILFWRSRGLYRQLHLKLRRFSADLHS